MPTAAFIIMEPYSSDSMAGLFDLPAGSVVRYASPVQWEDVVRWVEASKSDHILEGEEFEFEPVYPGSAFYTEYGPDHLIITVNDHA